jgi:hypothetical protein
MHQKWWGSQFQSIVLRKLCSYLKLIEMIVLIADCFVAVCPFGVVVLRRVIVLSWQYTLLSSGSDFFGLPCKQWKQKVDIFVCPRLIEHCYYLHLVGKSG